MPDSEIDFEPLLHLARLLSEARIRTEERAKVTHERFNVFTTLLSAHDEVRLHTRFLHCLLDPRGGHDCDSLFLDLFLATLAEVPALNDQDMPEPLEIPAGDFEWVVRKEASGSDGKIDLLLECRDFGLAIENKIFAAEQPGQLTRYGRYLRSRYGDSCRLIFLTLDGKTAYSHGGARYLRISYSEHILAWLEKCLRETYRFVPINQTLLQYREVVRRLTGQTLDSALMKTVTDFIVQNPSIIRHRSQIVKGIEAARAVFMTRLAEGIMSSLEGEFQVRLRTGVLMPDFGRHPNGALIITPPPTSPLHGEPFEIWVEHIQKWVGVVVGLETKFGKAPMSEPAKEILQTMNRLLDQHSTEAGYHKANPHTLWDGTDWPTGWHNLIEHPIDDQRLADLLQAPIAQVVYEVCEGIRAHIKLLEQVYLKAKATLPT